MGDAERDCYQPFFHHYQGSIDFNTVNIQPTAGMYFLIFTWNRDDIIYRDHTFQYTPYSQGVYWNILPYPTTSQSSQHNVIPNMFFSAICCHTAKSILPCWENGHGQIHPPRTLRFYSGNLILSFLGECISLVSALHGLNIVLSQLKIDLSAVSIARNTPSAP